MGFVECAGIVAAGHQHRGGLHEAGHAADHVTTLMMSREVKVIFAAGEFGLGDQLGAEFRVAEVEGPRCRKVVAGLGRVGVSGVEIGRIGALAAVGGHQQVARPPGTSEDQHSAPRIHDPANPIADVEPTAVPGTGLIDGADAIGEFALRVFHAGAALKVAGRCQRIAGFQRIPTFGSASKGALPGSTAVL
jgi:hypothetical protein